MPASKLPLDVAGTCSGTMAARILKRRSELGAEAERGERLARLAVVREMIDESWPVLARRLHRLEALHSGCAPYEGVCGEVMHCTGLQPADEPAVATLVRKCISNRAAKDARTGGTDYAVDVKKLWAETVGVEKKRRPVDWQRRFRADGVLQESVQKATTGVEKNARRYMNEYRGAPFACTADAACVEELTAQYQHEVQQRTRRVLMDHATFFEYADVNHPDHPDHHRLADEKEYAQGTSSSAKRVKSPLRTRQHKLPAGGEWILTTGNCREALLALPKGHLSEREILEMMKAVDPKLRGYYRVDDLMSRFSFELLKPKASRNTLGRDNNDGHATALEWPGSAPPPLGVTKAAERQWRKERANSARRPVGVTQAAVVRRRASVDIRAAEKRSEKIAAGPAAAALVHSHIPVPPAAAASSSTNNPKRQLAASDPYGAAATLGMPRHALVGQRRQIATSSAAIKAGIDPIALGNVAVCAAACSTVPQPPAASRPLSARLQRELSSRAQPAPTAAAVAVASPRRRPMSAR